MTDTTPQAAQVLTEQDLLECVAAYTAEVPSRLPPGWARAFKEAEKRILAKLQAATPAEPAQAVELPELPMPTHHNAFGRWPDLYTADQMQAYARAALSGKVA